MPRNHGTVWLVGNFTLDKTDRGARPGGSVFYAGACAHALGREVAVVTHLGQDFPLDAVRSVFPLALHGDVGGHTTRFVNEYSHGQRLQTVLESGESIQVEPGRVASGIGSEDLVLLSPVFGEVPAQLAAGVRGRLTGACIQGWMRSASEDGRVQPKRDLSFLDFLGGVDVIFYSDEDIGGDARLGARLRRHAPVVVETRGRAGAVVYQGETETVVPGHPTREVDPTGAGDTFAGAFMIHWDNTGDILEAARMACQNSAVEVSRYGPLTRADISGEGLLPIQ